MRKKITNLDKLFFLWILLDETDTAIKKCRRKELTKYNVTLHEAGIIEAINSLGNRATPADISRFIFQDPQSVSSMINEMQIKKILEKEREVIGHVQ